MILSDIARVRLGISLAAATTVVLAACGSDDGAESADDADDEPVIATTSIWADITSSVGCGTPIASLIPPGADPHTFEPSLQDRELVEHSTTVISNGLGLEANLSDLLDAASGGGVNVIEMTNDVDVITDDADHDDADHDDTDHDDTDHDDTDHDDTDHDADQAQDEHQHDHGGDGDPHVWQDPLRVAGTLDTIGSALAAHDIEICIEEYRDELFALDDEIVARLADVPAMSRVLVTSHDSLSYFADRYDFEIVGTVIASTSTMAETNAADLADLAEVIDEHNVPAIFTEELESTADADALADRLGVNVVPLVTDSLTDEPDSDTYVEMMRNNGAAIAAALAP